MYGIVKLCIALFDTVPYGTVFIVVYKEILVPIWIQNLGS
jgi:hypothetical protein